MTFRSPLSLSSLLILLYVWGCTPDLYAVDGNGPPRQAWEQAKRKHKGKGPVLSVRLPKNGAKLWAPQARFSGVTEPGCDVFVNWKPLLVYPTGAFAGVLPLKPGKNQFIFRSIHPSGRYTREKIRVYRHPPPEALPATPPALADTRPYEPEDALGLLPGDTLSVGFQGSPGARAWFRIGDDPREHPMRELSVKAGQASIAGMYRGTYRIEPDDAFVDASIRIFLEGLTKPGKRGKMRTVSDRVEGKLTTAWEKIHHRVVAKSDDTPLFVEADAYGERLTHVQKGTRLEITGQRGRLLRAKLAESKNAWVTERNTRLPDSDENNAADADSRLAAMRIEENPEKREVSLCLDFDLPGAHPAPLPLAVDTAQADNRIVMTVWGARGRGLERELAREATSATTETASDGTTTTATVPTHPFIESLQCKRLDDQTLVFTIDLATPRVWGCRAWFEGEELRLTLRRPPVVSTDPNRPLSGVKVLISAGHGGDDSGAVGPAGLNESDANLAISQRLAENIRSGGGQVEMIRTRDTSIDLEDRTKRIEASDADLFISVHNNSLGDTSDPMRPRGPLAFYTHGHQLDFAWEVQQAMPKVMQKSARRTHVRKRFFRVTRRSPHMPGVLAECLFLSHPEDEMLLLDPAFLDSLAESLYNGIVTFLHPERRAERPPAPRILTNKKRTGPGKVLVKDKEK